MTISKVLVDLSEKFWNKHFERLDKLAPHKEGSRAEIVSAAREVTTFACKNGVVYHFRFGKSLTFKHGLSGLTVEAKLNKLTDPVGLNFDSFPNWYDLGPLRMTDMSGDDSPEVIQKVIAEDGIVFLPRIVWFLSGSIDLNDGVARRLANDAHSDEVMNEQIWSARTSKAFKFPWEK